MNVNLILFLFRMVTFSPSRESSQISPAWLNVLLRFYGPLILLLAAIYARHPLSGDIDTWAHAAIGRWIWQNGQIPEQSLFIWGASPIRWVAHSWLSQVIFFGLLNLGGPGLVMIFTIFCVALAFALLWHAWTQRARPNVLIALFFVLAIICSSPRFYPRPELFTGLFLTCLLLFLVSRTERTFARFHAVGSWQFGAIVAMFALWANLHGAVAIGLLVLLLTLAADGVQDRFDARWRHLLVLVICCFGATLLNPYGAELWQALRAVKSETFKMINEWKPFWVAPKLDISYVIVEAVLTLCAGAVWLGNPQRRWAHGLWLLFAALSFVQARRNLWVLATVCLVVLIANASMLETDRFWRWWRSKTQGKNAAMALQPVPIGMRAIVRVGTIICLVIAVARATPSDFYKLRTLNPKTPVRLTQFYKNSKLNGRVFNDYEFSSYFQWAFAGKPPLYIDLLNAYPDSLLNDYFQVLDHTPRGRKILQGVDVILLRPFKPNERLMKLEKYLRSQPKTWVRVYWHDDGSIWIRRLPRFRSVWMRPSLKQVSSSHE